MRRQYNIRQFLKKSGSTNVFLFTNRQSQIVLAQMVPPSRSLATEVKADFSLQIFHLTKYEWSSLNYW